MIFFQLYLFPLYSVRHYWLLMTTNQQLAYNQRYAYQRLGYAGLYFFVSGNKYVVNKYWKLTWAGTNLEQKQSVDRKFVILPVHWISYLLRTTWRLLKLSVISQEKSVEAERVDMRFVEDIKLGLWVIKRKLAITGNFRSVIRIIRSCNCMEVHLAKHFY